MTKGNDTSEKDRHGNTPADYGYVGAQTDFKSLNEASKIMAEKISEKYQKGDPLNAFESAALILSIVEKGEYIPLPRGTEGKAKEYISALDENLRVPAQAILDGKEIGGEQLDKLGAEMYCLIGAAREIHNPKYKIFGDNYKQEEKGDTALVITNLTTPLLEIQEKNQALLVNQPKNRAEIFSHALHQVMFTNIDKKLDTLPKWGMANSISGFIKNYKRQLNWSEFEKSSDWFSQKDTPPSLEKEQPDVAVVAPKKVKGNRKRVLNRLGARLGAVAASAYHKVTRNSTRGRNSQVEQKEKKER